MIKDKKRNALESFQKEKKLDKIMAPRHNILHCFVQQKKLALGGVKLISLQK